VPAYINLAVRLLSPDDNRGPTKEEETEGLILLKNLAAFSPGNDPGRYFDKLAERERHTEAAYAFQLAEKRRAPKPMSRDAAEWSIYAEEQLENLPPPDSVKAPPLKCIDPSCIEGLEEALDTIDPISHVPIDLAPHRAIGVEQVMKAGEPVILGSAAEDWPPYDWGETPEALVAAAGEDEVKVTVTRRGAFEVTADRIDRAPHSRMRVVDLVALLGSRLELKNTTFYTRQAPLWSMPSLLATLTPLPWMERLKVIDLTMWMGDGHFHNTLHNDPHDNFLCQLHGTKHVLMYPPRAKDYLYYAPRQNTFADYMPSRGELNRKRTQIYSDNTAQINIAEPDLETFPRFAEALKLQRYAELTRGNCLYLPRKWHHVVFSEAEPQSGYNLAINIWFDREYSLGIRTPPPGSPDRLTLRELQNVLEPLRTAVWLPPADGTCMSDGA